MSKSTPGPWHASPTHMGAAFDIGAADGDNIALVIGPKENGSDNYKANAAAIAAVPRMLSALQWYARDYDSERGCSQWDGGAIARAALSSIEPATKGTKQ